MSSHAQTYVVFFILFKWNNTQLSDFLKSDMIIPLLLKMYDSYVK